MSAIAQRPAVADTHSPSIGQFGTRKILLACGIGFALLWVGMDIVASFLYEGYSYADQTVSELSAIGAPTRSLWMAFGVVWNVLVIAFAVGVWQSAGSTRALRVVAGLLIANAFVGMTMGPFSSMNQRQVLAAGGATLSDTLHLVVTGIGVFTFLLEIGFAASVFGKWFRLYSIATIAAMLVFGGITSFYAPEVQANQPTPWVGIYERINAYGYMLWIVVLSVTLWRNHEVVSGFGQEPGSVRL
jgi:uncharacterized protein DUF998